MVLPAEYKPLGEAARRAKEALGVPLTAWWCEPSIDFGQQRGPVTFGTDDPGEGELRVDEVVFFAAKASWRAARTTTGIRTVCLREVAEGTAGAKKVELWQTPVQTHADKTRFNAAALAGRDRWVVREWRQMGETLGYTLVRREQG